MEMRKYLWLLLFASLLGFVGCEDLDDTFDAGDGVIHYVGKCTDVSVSPGWNRLIVRWTNSVDPTVKNIKVLWSLDGVTQDTVLEKNATECSIPNLVDGNYEVRVCAVDVRDSMSLATPIFGRPYTPAHETIRSFSRLVSKHYYVKDRLAIFFSTWNEGITSATLTYYKKGETEPTTMELNSTLLENNPYWLLPDAIEPGSDVVLNREGRVEGCEDLIKFEEYKLEHEKLYTSDFKQWVKTKYGLEEITEEWVEAQKELEFDYSISSFEDILNFPNLQKVVLGKSRYMREDKLDMISSFAELYELERSLFVLDMANEVNGVMVDQYNKHYFTEERSYVTHLPNPQLPELLCYDASEWDITCSEEDEGEFDSFLERLFDGNVENAWQPELRSEARSYEINVDMKQMQMVKGVKIVQKAFDVNDLQSERLMPNMIQVKYSADDQATWHDLTYVEENTLGVTNGETTVLYFKEPQEVRYLRFIVNDQAYGSNFSVNLAEIGVFY